MRKYIYLFFVLACMFSFLMAQVPAHFDLYVQLKEKDVNNKYEPKKDARLDVQITIKQGSSVVYKETQSPVWTNYDGYLSIQVGKGNPTQWNNIDWNAATKKIVIEGRTNGQSGAQYKVLYEGDLPVAAYAQNAWTYSHSKPGVGSIKLFDEDDYPSIKLMGNHAADNSPRIDFATTEDSDWVARLWTWSDRKLYIYTKAGQTVFRRLPLTSDVELVTGDNAGINLKGGNPFVNFYPQRNATSPNGQIYLGSTFLIKSIGKNMLLDAGGSNLIQHTATKHVFNGGPIEVNGYGNFGSDDYTFLGHRDITPGPPDLGLGIWYGTQCDCKDDGNYVPFNTNGRLGTDSGDPLYSIKTSQGIRARNFHAYSDQRIKIKIDHSIGMRDLSSLKKLKVVNFHYKDPIKNGRQHTMGFIAQEVEEVVPEFVSRTTGVVPDIFQVGKNVIHDGDVRTLTVTVDSLPNLMIGERIQLIAKQEHLVEVVEVSGTSFKVRDWPEENTKAVFVYGREVDDFRTLDYNQIFTLNVSATQALIKEVDGLKTQLAALKESNETLQTENQTLKDELQKVNSRIEALAKIIGGDNHAAAVSNSKTN